MQIKIAAPKPGLVDAQDNIAQVRAFRESWIVRMIWPTSSAAHNSQFLASSVCCLLPSTPQQFGYNHYPSCKRPRCKTHNWNRCPWVNSQINWSGKNRKITFTVKTSHGPAWAIKSGRMSKLFSKKSGCIQNQSNDLLLTTPCFQYFQKTATKLCKWLVCFSDLKPHIQNYIALYPHSMTSFPPVYFLPTCRFGRKRPLWVMAPEQEHVINNPPDVVSCIAWYVHHTCHSWATLANLCLGTVCFMIVSHLLRFQTKSCANSTPNGWLDPIL